MRPVACLVPVRGLARGKQRLAPLLTETERAALVAAMLHDVLDALHRCARVALLAVVSDDPGGGRCGRRSTARCCCPTRRAAG